MTKENTQESGVILVLVSVFTVICLGAFAYFAYYVPLTKNVASDLRLKTEELCAQISSDSLMAEEAEQLFFGGLADLEVKNATVNRAVLFFNEMRSDAPFDILSYSSVIDDSGSGGDGTDTAGRKEAMPSFTPKILPSLPPSHPCNSGVECYAHGRLGFNNPGAGNNAINYGPEPAPIGRGMPTTVPVPESLVLRSYNSGNLIGCEISATVDVGILTNFLNLTGDTTTVARVIYQQVPTALIDGIFDPSARAFAGSNLNPTSPKLTIIIDPYFQTNTNEARFTPDPAVLSSGLDPASSAAAIEVFSANNPGVEFQNASDGIDIDFDGTADNINRFPVTAPSTTAEKEERLRACFNAPALARNAFLYHLLSYIVRDGFFLGNTSIYLTNPQHRVYFGDDPNVNFQNAHEYHPGIGNPPTAIFTNDLLGQSAEIPFLNFFGTMFPWTTSGDTAYDPNTEPYLTPRAYLDRNLDGTRDINPMGSPLTGGNATALQDHRYSQGFTQPFHERSNVNTTPFNGPSPRAADQMAYHSLVSGQLRDCFGLYNGDGTSGVAIDSGWFGPANQFDKEAINRLTADTAPASVGGHSSLWGPTYSGTNPIIPGQGANQPRLNALEFVSVLGAAQSCPVAARGGTAFGDHCYKPANALSSAIGGTSGVRAGDLRGDMLAALMHLAREPLPTLITRNTPWQPETAGSVRMPAVTIPGLTFQSSPFCLGNTGGSCTSNTLNPVQIVTPYLNPNPRSEYFVRPALLTNCNDYAMEKADWDFAECNSLYNRQLGQDDLSDPPIGDNIILIVTSQPPLEGELEVWKRFLTGNWEETAPGEFRIRNPVQSNSPVLQSHTTSFIGVVHFDPYSNNHTEADAAYSLWQNAIMGAAGDSTSLSTSTGPTNGNYFQSRRRVFFMSPFGEQRYFSSASDYADSCDTAVADPSPVETCEYGELVGTTYGTADDAYVAYYSHLLGGNAGGGAGQAFGGNVKDRALGVLNWIKKVRRLF